MNWNCFDPASCFYPLTNCLRNKAKREREDPKPVPAKSDPRSSPQKKSNLSGVSHEPLDIPTRRRMFTELELHASAPVASVLQASAPVASVLQAYAPSLAQLLCQSEPAYISAMHSHPFLKSIKHPSVNDESISSKCMQHVDPFCTEIRIRIESEAKPAQYESARACLEPVHWGRLLPASASVHPKLLACQSSASAKHSPCVPKSSTPASNTDATNPESRSSSITSAARPNLKADVPHPSASVPGSSAHVLHSSTSVPRSSKDAPHSSASVPQSSAAVPRLGTSAPRSSAAATRSSASAPQSSTAVPHPSARIKARTTTSADGTTAPIAFHDDDAREPVHVEGQQKHKTTSAEPSTIKEHGDASEENRSHVNAPAKDISNSRTSRVQTSRWPDWTDSRDIEVFQQPNDGHQNWCSCKKPKKAKLQGYPCVTGAMKGVVWENAVHLKDGGFGQIYCVHYKGQKMAIKVQELTGQAFDEINFLRNMKSHPNVLPLKVYALSEKFVVSLSPLAVTDINNVVRHFKGLPRESIPFIIASALCAVHHLHSRHIAHRDIKEHNILLMRDGTPVLTDFGVASKFNPKTQKCPRAEYPIGSRGYKSPEVARDLLSGPAMDLWALGCVMCRCINGRIPHDYINERYSLRYYEHNYNIKALGKFQFLDLDRIYQLTDEERMVISACFIDNEAKRTTAVRQATHSEYFRDVDMSAIQHGYRIPKHHGRMQQLVERYIHDHDKHPFHVTSASGHSKLQIS